MPTSDDERLSKIERMGFGAVTFPRHVGSCKTCKRELESSVFTIAEARALLADVQAAGRVGWCANCELDYCRHVPVGAADLDAGAANAIEEDDYDRRRLAVGLTDAVLDRVFLSSGQPDPRHVDDLAAAMEWVEGGSGDPPKRSWSWL